MARLIQHHAHNGGLAGVGLLGIAASIVLALSLGIAHPAAHGSSNGTLPAGLRSLLASLHTGA
ncbi:hypothetical protein A9179_21215 [Pseudomonas alcaligenes]|uniref:Uncharacterized protein n=1 Tax=Aquipseudomonas alcaligenes TaxID=43263 RepID=A0ABR7S8Q5_AQUAC|nr:hypothetical protein [Pseudomonas alcaligenes]MBC9252793.1 hypothetical protein [Pseudomonas alcaligenes]